MYNRRYKKSGPYRNKYYGYGYNKSYSRTRYNSTRPIGGLYRTSSKYNLSGRARRFFSNRRLKQALFSIAEHKYFDTQQSYTNFAINPVLSAGKIDSLTEITQGQSDITRIGDKSTGLSLQMRLQVASVTIATSKHNYLFRVIIFIWKDDTTPLTADILDNNAGFGLSPLSFYNHDKTIKRKILYDKTYDFFTYVNTTPNILSVHRPNYTMIEYIPLTKLNGGSGGQKDLNVINFAGGTTTGVNKIYMLTISNADAAPEGWDTNISVRYNFIDM